jgi:hypothetical protein
MVTLFISPSSFGERSIDRLFGGSLLAFFPGDGEKYFRLAFNESQRVTQFSDCMVTERRAIF